MIKGYAAAQRRTEKAVLCKKSLKLCGNAVKRKMDACLSEQNALHYKYEFLMSAFCKKHFVIKEPRRNGKNDLEKV